MNFVLPQTRTATLKMVAFWVLKIALGLMFVAAGFAKIIGVQAMVAEFDVVGLGQWFRYFTGTLEVISGFLFIWPKTTVYGSVLLALICAGAFVAQLMVLHGDVFHAIAFVIIFASIAWASRNQLAFASPKLPQHE